MLEHLSNGNSRYFNNLDQKEIIAASSDNDIARLQFLLQASPSNPHKYAAFETALNAKNWAALTTLIRHNVTHGPQKFRTTAFNYLFANQLIFDFTNLMLAVIEATNGAKFSDQQVTDLKELLFELAKIDTSLTKQYTVRGCDTIPELCKPQYELVKTNPYIHLFSAAGFAFARTPLHNQIENRLLKYHLLSTTHGSCKFTEVLTFELPEGKKVNVTAEEHLTNFLNALGTNRDGCRDLFYEVYFRIGHGITDQNLAEGVKSKLYMNPKYVENLLKEPNQKFYILEIDDTKGKIDSKTPFDFVAKNDTKTFAII